MTRILPSQSQFYRRLCDWKISSHDCYPTLISINNCPLNFDGASDVPPPQHHVNRKKCQSKMALHQPSRKVGPVIKNPPLLLQLVVEKKIQKVVFLSSRVVNIAYFSILWNKLKSVLDKLPCNAALFNFLFAINQWGLLEEAVVVIACQLV